MDFIPEAIFEQFLLAENILIGAAAEQMESKRSQTQQPQQQHQFEGAEGSGVESIGDPFSPLAGIDPAADLHPMQNMNTDPYMEELSQASNFEDWACEDFNIFDFVGQDGDELNTYGNPQASAATSEDPYECNKEEDSLQKPDYMYSVMQYNQMAGQDPMHSFRPESGLTADEMNGNFMQGDRYSAVNGNSGLLSNTISKLHQQQHLSQPSTSRISSPLQQQQQPPQQPPQPNYRMRLNGQTQQLMNGAEMSENVMLGASSTSPQNNNPVSNLFYPVKTEPDMYDSASDTESHYSHNGMGGSKPRKYRIKPESERANPTYIMKRAKNNDAVRRSREKAKAVQQEKERKLERLERERSTVHKQMSDLNDRLKAMEKEILRMRGACTCGAASFRH